MAGALNGIGGPQLPVNNTVQSSGQSTNQTVREREDSQPQENVVQPQNTAPASVQNTETGNQDILQGRVSQAIESGDTNQAAFQRGSILDIQV